MAHDTKKEVFMTPRKNTLYYAVYTYLKNHDKKHASDYTFEDMFDKSKVES